MVIVEDIPKNSRRIKHVFSLEDPNKVCFIVHII